MKAGDVFVWRGSYFTPSEPGKKVWNSVKTATATLDATVEQFSMRPEQPFCASIRSGSGAKTGWGESPGEALDKAYGAWSEWFHSLPQSPIQPKPLRRCASCYRMTMNALCCDTCVKDGSLGSG